MTETVYIETSILGYLTARSSRDLIVAANIAVTQEWWVRAAINSASIHPKQS
jgi:hypothetical protein